MDRYLIGVEVKHNYKVSRRPIQEYDGRRWQFCGYMEDLEQANRFVSNDTSGRYEYKIIELKEPKMVKELV